MLRASGMGVLRPIVYELQQQLREGYMRHVCNYSVRTVLVAALQGEGGGADGKDGGDRSRGGYSPPSMQEAPSLMAAILPTTTSSSTSSESINGGGSDSGGQAPQRCLPCWMRACLCSCAWS